MTSIGLVSADSSNHGPDSPQHDVVSAHHCAGAR